MLPANLGRKSKKEWKYIYLQLFPYAVEQEPTKHCKATIIQKPKQNKIPEIATVLPLQKSIGAIRRKKNPTALMVQVTEIKTPKVQACTCPKLCVYQMLFGAS